MAFRFPLATLLRFRQRRERQEEVLMQQANFQVGGLRLSIEELQHAVAALAARSSTEMQSGTSAAELHFNELRLATLAKRHENLNTELAKAEKARDLRRHALQQARQQREVVDTLRTRQLHAYGEEQRRQEQQTVDDLFLLRRKKEHSP